MKGHVITSTETTSVDGVDEVATADSAAARVPSSNGQPAAFLSDVVVELGFADATVVERAGQEARQRGRSVTEVLLEGGELTEEQLARAIAARNGLDYVDLDEFDVDLGVAELIGPSVARRHRAVPIAFDKAGELVVAIADPVDALAISDIAVIAKSNVRTVVASGSAIDAVIECLDGLSVPAHGAGGPKAAPHPPATDESLPQHDQREQDATPVAAPDDEEGTGEDVAAMVVAAQADTDVIGDALERARFGAADTTGSSRLQERIIGLVEPALDGAAEFEVSALEAELTREQEARGILEAELAIERQVRGALEAKLSAELERLLVELRASTTRADHRS